MAASAGDVYVVIFSSSKSSVIMTPSNPSFSRNKSCVAKGEKAVGLGTSEYIVYSFVIVMTSAPVSIAFMNGCNAVLYKRPSCVMDALIFTCKSPVPGKSRTVATTFSLRQPWMAATTCLVVYLFDAPYDVSSSAAIFAFG